MKSLITTESTKCFLLATGWVATDRPEYPGDPLWTYKVLGRPETAFGISAGVPMLSEIARAMLITQPELCARLGVLAAIEQLLGPDNSRRLETWPTETIDLLRLIGINPQAWEETRRACRSC